MAGGKESAQKTDPFLAIPSVVLEGERIGEIFFGFGFTPLVFILDLVMIQYHIIHYNTIHDIIFIFRFGNDKISHYTIHYIIFIFKFGNDTIQYHIIHYNTLHYIIFIFRFGMIQYNITLPYF